MIVSDLQPYSRFPVLTFPLFEVLSDSWVCVKEDVCHLFQLLPLRGFGGLPNKWLATFPSLDGSPREWSMWGVRFVTFSSLSPFGGSGAYWINDSPHSPFPSLHSPSPWERDGVRIPLSFDSKPRFYHFLHCCIILWVNHLYTLSIPIVQDSYKLPISSL